MILEDVMDGLVTNMTCNLNVPGRWCVLGKVQVMCCTGGEGK